MSRASSSRPAIPRDWLLVDSPSRHAANPISTGVASTRISSLAATGSLLRKFQDRCDRVNLSEAARTSIGKAAWFMRETGERLALHSAAAVEALEPTLTKPFRRGWPRAAWLLSHPWTVLLALAVLLPCGYLAYCIATLPLGGGLVIEPTPSAMVVETEGGQVFATRGVFKGEHLAPQDVPPDLAKAIVAIEDRHFYEHGGFYLPSMLRAALRNLLAGSAREGGSTITQQLARMMYLSPERTFKRKVQEAVLTLWLEHHLDKREILTRYLNTAYFGAGVYGVDAAAKRYFGKTAKELSLAEAAMLAGLVRAPSALAPNRNLEGAQARASRVLDAMVETGAISAEQAGAARKQPVRLRVRRITLRGRTISSTCSQAT